MAAFCHPFMVTGRREKLGCLAHTSIRTQRVPYAGVHNVSNDDNQCHGLAHASLGMHTLQLGYFYLSLLRGFHAVTAP